ncbi:MAG: hypothetical protein VXW78_01855, partial [Pseudomonadota bacterium]|nr:hypothetical protein [Pseudomonadota bacterium]
RGTIIFSVKNNRLVADCSSKQLLSPNFVIPCGNIPEITGEHFLYLLKIDNRDNRSATAEDQVQGLSRSIDIWNRQR